MKILERKNVGDINCTWRCRKVLELSIFIFSYYQITQTKRKTRNKNVITSQLPSHRLTVLLRISLWNIRFIVYSKSSKRIFAISSLIYVFLNITNNIFFNSSKYWRYRHTAYIISSSPSETRCCPVSSLSRLESSQTSRGPRSLTADKATLTGAKLQIYHYWNLFLSLCKTIPPVGIIIIQTIQTFVSCLCLIHSTLCTLYNICIP